MVPSMARRTPLIAAAAAAMLGTFGAATVLAAHTASAAAAFGVAPYVDMSNNAESELDKAISSAGVKYYTAAFIIGSGCTPIWGDSQPIGSSPTNAEIARAQSEGAQTIISFGGAAGAELAQTCTSTGSLTAAYQSVINKYHVNHLDFDIEGAAIADPGSINRRFQAIKALENNNAGLVVSLTIPVLQSGPDGNGQAFLNAAHSNGVRVAIVNAMTMDYGGTVSDMGAAAISAAKGTLAAAKSAGLTSGFSGIGITPMIGHNDSAGEVFTKANAQAVVKFANSNGIGRLAFWSVSRDQQCKAGTGGGASPVCSGVSQGELDFTRIFTAFTGGGGGGGGGGGNTFVGAGSGKCIDDPKSSTTNGTQLEIWTCNGGANQKITATGGTLRVMGKCFDAPKGATANGTIVEIWTCNGGANQKFAFNSSNGTIVGSQSGKCVTVQNASTANGGKLILSTCTGAANQKWSRK
jgi:chitinase